MKRLTTKNHKSYTLTVITTLFFGQSLFERVAFAVTPQKAWETPSWGFNASKIPLKKSLAFDQPTDAVSYRPFPLLATQIVAPELLASSKLTAPSPLPVPTLKSTAPENKLPEKITRNPVIAPTPTPAPAKKPQPQPAIQQAQNRYINPTKIKAEGRYAKVLVIEEDSLMLKRMKAMPKVSIQWMGEGSGLTTQTDDYGLAHSPYPNTHSIRFIAKAPGFLPALGYAVGGIVTPIVMVPEKKVPGIVKLLGLTLEPEKVLVLGHILDQNYQPVDSMTLDTSSVSTSKIFYSGKTTGIYWSQITRDSKEIASTGLWGDFLVSGLETGIQYLMPSRTLQNEELKTLVDHPEASEQQMNEWPAFIGSFDFNQGKDSMKQGSSPVVSVTIQKGTPKKIETQVVDAFSWIRPSSGIRVNVSGQRDLADGLNSPDEEGFVKPENLFLRSGVDIIEIQSQGYRPSWISSVASRENFPSVVPMFTENQLQTVFQKIPSESGLEKSVVMGALRPERFTREVKINVYNSAGKKNKDAKVYYFASEGNQVDPTRTSTDRIVQRFTVSNLGLGEWHVMAIDAKTGRGLGVQVIRAVEDGSIIPLQF